MSIMWKYLDKRSAAVAAIKDFASMRFIINSTGDEIKKTYEKMNGVSGTRWDGMPKVHNPRAGEERILNTIDEIDVLKERYRQAVEYMEWFQPAWRQLTDEEQYVLETFYSDANGYGCNAVYYIADYLKVETPTVYKRKNRALDRLIVLLFGKG